MARLWLHRDGGSLDRSIWQLRTIWYITKLRACIAHFRQFGHGLISDGHFKNTIYSSAEKWAGRLSPQGHAGDGYKA